MKTSFQKRLFTLLFATLFFSINSTKASEIETIKQNYRKILLGEDKSEKALLEMLISLPAETYYSDQMVVELMERYPIKTERVKELFSKIQKDGSWSDIDYANQNRSGWLSKMHVERILELTKAYCKSDSEFFYSEELENAIHLTLNYWYDKKPKSNNWWHNQIGVPKLFGAILILFQDKLTNREKDGGIEVLNNAKFGMTGQNKVWLAGNVLVRGLLQNDFDLVKAARDTIASEIRTDQREGIKADYSFHQHGAQQQFGNYGAAYIASLSFWARLFNGTSVAFEQPQLNVLSDLINKGYARILWKGYMDVNALGRQFFHQAQVHKGFTVGFTASALAEVDKEDSAKYSNLLKENFFDKGKNMSLVGLYHFWKSDQTVYRKPTWMASIKMSSNRVIGAESGNGDNQKGYYLADGATYTYTDGNEYNNIFPCWDWRKIPGITSYETDAPLKMLTWLGHSNKSDFVGNVTNGHTGITAMDFVRDGLIARKSWVFTDDFIFCMGAGIKSDSGCIVTTSIDQRIKGGDLLYLNNKQWQVTSEMELSKNEHRFFHDKTGYVILNPMRGKALSEERTGKWHDIMATYPDQFTDVKDVFSLWLDHGKDPQDESYQYIILPATTKQQVEKFDLNNIKVISNTRSSQVVFITNSSTFYLALYEPGSVQLDKNIHFKSSEAGLFMIKKNGKGLEVVVADPTQKLEELNIEINRKSKRMTLPSGEMRGTSQSLNVRL